MQNLTGPTCHTQNVPFFFPHWPPCAAAHWSFFSIGRQGRQRTEMLLPSYFPAPPLPSLPLLSLKLSHPPAPLLSGARPTAALRPCLQRSPSQPPRAGPLRAAAGERP